MDDFMVVARTPSRSLRRKRTNSLYAQRKCFRIAERITSAEWLKPRGKG